MGEISGANKRARRAASRAARAQQAAAGQLRQDVEGLMEATPQQLAAEEQALGVQSKNLEKQERLISSLDPAILQASEQALSILKGEESQFLAPVRAQRQRQRQRLLDTLRQQLGPGAETSSAGQQALQKFDLETSDILAGRQESSLSQLFGMAGQGTGLRSQISQGAGALASMSGAQQDRGLGRARILGNIGQGEVQTAGARFTGDLIRAQQLQQLGGDLSKAFGAGAGMLVGGLAGGPQGAQAGASFGSQLFGGGALSFGGGGGAQPDIDGLLPGQSMGV